MNQSKLEVITGSWRKARPKTRASNVTIDLVLLLIGWKIGTSFLSQSCGVANAKPITFRHSNETALSYSIVKTGRPVRKTFSEDKGEEFCQKIHTLQYQRGLLFLFFKLIVPCRCEIREFKKLLRRRRRQRRLKNEFIFHLRISEYSLSHLLCLSLSKLSRNWIWDIAINLN